MIQLSDSDLDAAAKGHPVRLIDPSRRESFVLVSAQIFERLSVTNRAATDIETGYQLLADVSPDDWEDLANYEANDDHATPTR